MGIWERFANVLKSYINDGTERVFGEDRPRFGRRDDDYNAAYEELNDFLKGGKDSKSETKNSGSDKSGAKDKHKNRYIPPELKKDFAELGLSPGASEDVCKEAYKKLLKIHHPDRHTGDPENIKKATEKAAKINAAYDRLVIWFKTGS